jgi:hypothetical protein
MSNAKPDSPSTRGCAFILVSGITVLFGLAASFAVFLEVQDARWEASKLTRVQDAVAKMKAERGHRLFLYSTRNVDEQLKQIRGMSEIEEILLSDGADLTAEGMKHIGTLPNLKRFTTSALVGDEGLLALRDCKSLEWVSVFDDSISPEAIAELQSHIPKANIGTVYEEIEDPHPPTQVKPMAEIPDTKSDSN